MATSSEADGDVIHVTVYHVQEDAVLMDRLREDAIKDLEQRGVLDVERRSREETRAAVRDARESLKQAS